MASAIFFNGRRINIPQAVARIDASALSSVSPAAVGIVGLIGTAEGGKPLCVEESVSDFTTPESLRGAFRSGDLKIAGAFCFEPSADDAVPGGAQKVVAVKVNPATQSAITLPDALAADSVDLLSLDYGQFTSQINIEVDPGTTKGKLITVIFEDTVETFDDVGGDAIMDILYTPGAGGWDTMTGAIAAAAFTAAATRSDTGLTTERTADLGGNSVLNIASSAAGDTTQSVTAYGLNAAGDPIFETIALNGVTPVQGLLTFSTLFGVELDAACVGTITVSNFPVTITLFTMAPAVTTRGVIIATNMPLDAAGFPTVSIDVDSAGTFAYLYGESPAGAAVAEEFDMTSGNTTPVVGAVAFRKVTRVVLGDVAAARTITIAANAEVATVATFPTVQKLVDRLNTLDGFTANGLVSNVTTFLVADADYSTAVTLIGAAAEFYADLDFFLAALNAGSQLVSATRATGATSVPADTTAPVFLLGGIEGVTTITQWTEAFTLLQKRRCTTIVPLTRDPAVHNLLLSHLVARAGRLARIAGEANGYIGLGKSADGTGETRSNIQTQIQVIQTRHISALAQEVNRFDPDTGEATWYPPYILSAISAGMQAGSAIAEPLTRKRPIANDIRNDASWTIEDNASDLIDRGLMMYEKVDGVGVRCIRSVTTHLADDNVVFVEMSANESANTAIFELRRRLELKVGNRGLASSVAVIKGLAFSILGQLIDDDIIVAFRSLQVEQIADVFPVSVEVAPVLPINFIPITVHLVALRIAA